MKMKVQDKIIRYDSPEAAQHTTLSGWLGGGMFYPDSRGPNAEDMARYAGCTHKICECGELYKKGYTMCEACRRKKDSERYNAKEFKEWDGKGGVYSELLDKYFFSVDEIEEYINDQDEDEDQIAYDDLRLVICQPNYLRPFEIDYDEFPEDQDEGDLCDKELLEKLNELNVLVKNHKPISYSPGKYRTSYNPNQSNPSTPA